MRRALPLSVLIVACGGAARPVVPANHGVDPTGGGAPAGSLDEARAALARGEAPDAICFAWSAATRTAACAVDESSIQAGAMMAVRFIGDRPAEHVYYRHPEDRQFFGVEAEFIDQAALAAIDQALRDGGFVAWDFAPRELEPGAEGQVGAVALRRSRVVTGDDGDPMTGVWDTFTDTVEARCGGAWRPVALPATSFGSPIGEVTIATLTTPAGQLVFTASWHFGIEGDSGGGADAVSLPALCP